MGMITKCLPNLAEIYVKEMINFSFMEERLGPSFVDERLRLPVMSARMRIKELYCEPKSYKKVQR